MGDVNNIIAKGGNFGAPDIGKIFETAYKIKEMQKNQREQNALRSFFADPSNLDPKTQLPTDNALAKLTREAPTAGFKVTEEVAKVENQRALTDERTLKQKLDKDNILQKSVREPAATAYDNAIKAGVTPEQAQATAQKVYDEGLDTVRQSGEFSKGETDQFAANFDIDRVRTASKINQIHNQPKSGDVETITDAKGDTFDHNKLTGANVGVSGPDVEPGKPYSPQGGVHKLAGAGDTGSLDEAGVNYYAKEFRTLGPTALGRLTKGDRDKVINRAAEEAGGDSAPDLRTQQGIVGHRAEETAMGRGVGQLRRAEEEMEGAVQLSHNAYSKLPRGSFVPFNELANLYEKKTSSPEQAAAYAADNAIVNLYARMISPTGQGTDSDKAHAREMLNQAQGPQAHEAVLNQLMAEGKNALSKAEKAQRDTTASTPIAGNEDARPQAQSHTPPLKTLQENHVTTYKNGQKWTLRNGKPVQVQ